MLTNPLISHRLIAGKGCEWKSMRQERAREDVSPAESTSHRNFSEVHPGACYAKHMHEHGTVAAVMSMARRICVLRVLVI